MTDADDDETPLDRAIRRANYVPMPRPDELTSPGALEAWFEARNAEYAAAARGTTALDLARRGGYGDGGYLGHGLVGARAVRLLRWNGLFIPWTYAGETVTDLAAPRDSEFELEKRIWRIPCCIDGRPNVLCVQLDRAGDIQLVGVKFGW